MHTTFFLVVYYTTAIVAGLLIGIEANVIGGVLGTRSFVYKFLPEVWIRQSLAKSTVICHFINIPTQLLGSAYDISALSFFIVAAFAYARLKGQWLLCLGAFINFIGHCFYIPAKMEFLITGRGFVGAGTALITLGVQSLTYNINQADHKGKVENMYIYSKLLGATISYAINTIGNTHFAQIAWKISFMSTLPLSILLLICSFFYYFDGSMGNNNMGVPIWNSIKLLFREENRKKAKISTVKEIMLPLTDFGLLLTWSPVILQSLHLSVKVAYDVTLALSIIQLVFIRLSAYIINFFGRREMLVCSGICIMIIQGIIFCLMIVSGNLEKGFPIMAGIGILAFVGVFHAFKGCLASTSGWLETPLPDDCKIGSLAWSQGITFIMNIMVAWTSLPLFCRLQGFTFIFLLAIVGVMVILVYFLVRRDDE